MFSINTNEHLADNATEMDADDNASADGLLGSGASVSSNKTSVSQRSAGLLAREQDFASEREKFNAELNRVKERNRQEREDQEAATVAAAERVRHEQAEQQAVITNLQQQMALLQVTQASSGAEEPPPPD
jgi:vacuolar-type H+-ATPase subunit I/STV1